MTEFTPEQAKLLGQVLGGMSQHDAMERQRLTLIHPREEDVEFWLRTHVVEAKNAIMAHMEIFAKGEVPGLNGVLSHQSKESSYYALQTIEDDLARYTLDLVRPIPALDMPLYLRLAARLLTAYLEVSKQMPLGKEGATTNHDAAKYAKLLTAYLSTLVALLSPSGGDPLKLWQEWQKRKFL